MENSIESWITPSPTVIDLEEILVNAIQKMGARKIGAILVTENDKLAGIFTERDLLRMFSDNTEKAFKEHLLRPIREFMTASPICAKSKEDYNTVYARMKTHNIRHIPILEGEKLVGIVSMRDLIHHYQNRLETAVNEARQEIEELKKLATVANGEKVETLIKEVQKYKELSLTDHLTGLFNKRYFQTRIVEEVSRARRSSFELSLIFCDIDHFKRINDRFGHQIGDDVLRTTARLLSGSIDQLNIIYRLRKSDIIARYGGEEFVIILPETGKRGAITVAERLREKIADYTFKLAEEDVHMTMSFGIAELSPTDKDHSEIIKNADYAMYKAKNSGRNRVAVYPSDDNQT
ncbi:MAG: diguanylate cyclase [Spirochaetaceae bacterium]|nr:MAG: diguanylate cyclase [Spirochaetaceae bacterium]